MSHTLALLDNADTLIKHLKRQCVIIYIQFNVGPTVNFNL